MYIFFDRTNVRSNLLLLGHLPNLVGHCPMSDSNLQPCHTNIVNRVKKMELPDKQHWSSYKIRVWSFTGATTFLIF